MNNRIKPPSVMSMPEVLCNISGNLPKKDLFNLSQCCFFFNKTLKEYKSVREARAKQNIIDFNCDKKIVKTYEKINGIVLWENSAIIFNETSIKVLDKKNSVLIWDYQIDKSYSFNRVWVTEEKVICMIVPKRGIELNSHIQILNVHTGILTSSILFSELQTRFTTVNDNEIITRLYNGEINCWNTSGKKIKSYQSYHTQPIDFSQVIHNASSYLMIANSDYIVNTRYNEIWIINRKDPQIVTVKLDEDTISVATISKDNVIVCATLKGILRRPHIVVINIKQYIENGTIQYYKSTFAGSPIRSIVTTDNSIFFVHGCGRVYALNLSTQQQQLLENLAHCSYELSVEHHYLFIKSMNLFDNNKLHIWDISNANEMKKIRIVTNENYSLKSVLWFDNTLLLATDDVCHSSLVSYDFNVNHKRGEVLIQEDIIEDDIILTNRMAP